MDHTQKALPNVQFESGNLDTLIKLVKLNSGFTLLPQLAVDELSEADLPFVRHFKKPIPTREVSLVYNRSFLKETIITSLENCILNNLPKQIKSLKQQHIDVVAI